MSTRYYLRARYYDPSTGQFISQDPISMVTREPYAYVADNPLNHLDPSGMIGGGICTGGAGGIPIIGGLLGPMGSLQRCIVVTQGKKGFDVAATYTGGIYGGAMIGNQLGGGCQFEVSPYAQTTEDFGGPFGDIGSSASGVGDLPLQGSFDWATGQGPSGPQTVFTGGVGVGIPGAEVHAGVTGTKVSHNPLDIISNAIQFVMPFL